MGLDAGGLNLGAFEFTDSVMSTTDSSAITIDQAVTVASDLTVGGNLLPNTANGGDLGSLARPWRSLYVSNTTIYIGGVPLSLDENGNLLVDGNLIQGGGGSITTDATAPVSPTEGNLWYDTVSGRIYIYYDSSWVDASPVDGAGISSTNELVNGASSFSVSSDGTLTLTHPAEPNYHPLSTTLTIQKAAGNYHTISGAYGLSLQATPVPSGYGLNTNTNFVDIFHDGVSVNVNDNTWIFGTDGTLTLPDSATLAVGSEAEIEALALVYTDYRDQLDLVFADANYTGDGWPADNTSYARLTASTDPDIQPSWIVLAEAAFDAYDAMLEAQQSIDFKINVYGREWQFTSDRSNLLNSLTIPENTTISGPDSIELRAEGSGNKEAKIELDAANNRVSIGTTSLGWVFSNNGILSLPTVGKIGNGNFEWAFDETGTLTVPSPSSNGFFLTFASDNYEGTVPKPTLTLTDTPWLVEGQYVYAANGESQLTLGAIGPNLVNPGYESGDTFVFEAYGADDQANHGIKGYTLTITLTSVVEGPSGWTATATESAAPIYPSTILTSGAIKLTNNVDTSWIFGTDGNLTLPPGSSRITSYGQVTIETDNNGSGMYANATGVNLLYANTNVTLRANSTGTNKDWTFGTDGDLTLPVGGDILDSNGDSVLGGGSYTPDDSGNWNDPTVNNVAAALDELAAKVAALENFEIDGGNAYTPAAGELIIDGNGA